jgi:hypothetical protein
MSVGLGEVKKRLVAGGFCVTGVQSFLGSPEARECFRR